MRCTLTSKGQQKADITCLVCRPKGRCEVFCNLKWDPPSEKLLQPWKCHQDTRKARVYALVCECKHAGTLILYALEAQGQQQYHSTNRRSADPPGTVHHMMSSALRDNHRMVPGTL